jgi:dTDP-4-dehydrorhamnose 3,5-epimerase-like enzyme
MFDVEGLNFDKNDNGILFTGTYIPGRGIHREIVDGDSISLKKGDVFIEVRDIKRHSKGKLRGLVQYVDPYQSLKDQGIDDGVEITFKYKYIFACQHK